MKGKSSFKALLIYQRGIRKSKRPCKGCIHYPYCLERDRMRCKDYAGN